MSLCAKRNRLVATSPAIHYCRILPPFDRLAGQRAYCRPHGFAGPTTRDRIGLSRRPALDLGAHILAGAYDNITQQRNSRLHTQNINYSSSGSIRLFVVHGGSGNEPLQGRLVTTTIGDAPEFDALSYVWGAPEPSETIDCDQVQVTITKNLAHCLRRVRPRRGERTLWADQICINQGDLDERADQVNLIGQLFERAKSVVMWLGLDDHKKPQAAMCADLLTRVARSQMGSPIEQDPGDKESSEILALRGLPEPQDPAWAALSALFLLPYFARLWIYQEVALAASTVIYWGTIELSFSDVKAALGFIRHSGNIVYIRALVENQLNHPARHLLALQKAGLSELLRRSRQLEASDPRDKVFGLLGLMEEERTPWLEVNYSRSVASVFEGVAMHILVSTSRIDFLADAGTSFKRVPGLPSIEYLADLEPAVAQGYLAALGTTFLHFRAQDIGKFACDLSDAPARPPPDPDILASFAAFHAARAYSDLAAGKIGIAEATAAVELASLAAALHTFGDKDTRDVDWSSQVRLVRRWRDHSLDAAHRADSHWFTASTTQLCELFSETWVVDEDFHALIESFALLMWPHREALDSHLQFITNRYVASNAWRRVFITDQGGVGMGLLHTVPGDVVVSLFGCNDPVVLRQIEGGWLFVGECDYEGVMEGQYVQRLRDHGTLESETEGFVMV